MITLWETRQLVPVFLDQWRINQVSQYTLSTDACATQQPMGRKMRQNVSCFRIPGPLQRSDVQSLCSCMSSQWNTSSDGFPKNIDPSTHPEGYAQSGCFLFGFDFPPACFRSSSICGWSNSLHQWDKTSHPCASAHGGTTTARPVHLTNSWPPFHRWGLRTLHVGARFYMMQQNCSWAAIRHLHAQDFPRGLLLHCIQRLLQTSVLWKAGDHDRLSPVWHHVILLLE